MKKQKLILKLLLDAAMFIVFLLVIRKNNFGMTFHEIAGLAVLGAFLLHVILNYRWVLNVTGRLFSKKTPVSTKIGYVLNAALLVCFALIGISGALISKVVFSFNAAGNWKTVHYFCTALALILVGLHLGLHARMLGGLARKVLHLPPKAAKILCAVFAVCIVALGCYSAVSTSFVRWLSMPFTASASFEGGRGEGFAQQGDMQLPSDIEGGQLPTDAETTQSGEAAQGGGRGMGKHDGTGSGEGRGSGNGQGQGGEAAGGSALSIICASLQYLSIVGLFAVISAGVSFIAARAKSKRKAA